MNGYVAIFNGKHQDIYADTLFQAKEKALEFFKPRKSQAHMVSVHLCEKDGRQVEHTPDF